MKNLMTNPYDLQLKVESTILTLELVYETPKAWLVLGVCELCDSEEEWLPKSQCRLIDISSGLITLEVPEWLIKAKNLK